MEPFWTVVCTAGRTEIPTTQALLSEDEFSEAKLGTNDGQIVITKDSQARFAGGPHA